MMAISGWRRLIFLSDFLDSIVAEGSYTHIKNDADKLMQALKDQGLQDTSINETTQKRYLALGKRAQSHKKSLMKWELFHQRDSLVDAISTLRHIFSISDREDDIAYIMNLLFLQQRAGIRGSMVMPKSKNDVKTPQNIGKGLLIKRMVLMHLMETCPDIATTLQPFADQTHFELQYGVLPSGEKVREVGDVDDDDDACHTLTSPVINSILMPFRIHDDPPLPTLVLSSDLHPDDMIVRRGEKE